jgi:uncharacterized protein (DUF2267 family)
MLTTHVSSLNATVQKTQEWLHELADIGGFIGEAQAYTAMRSVLHVLRDRLTVDEAAHLGAQLPMLVRGIYYEGWKPAATPVRERSGEDFLRRVEAQLGNADVGAESACRAVFELLDRKITSGEVKDVRHMLPREVRDFWP